MRGMVEGEHKSKGTNNLPRASSSRVVTSMEKEIGEAEDSRLTEYHAGFYGIDDRQRSNGGLEQEEEADGGGRSAGVNNKGSCDVLASKNNSETTPPSSGAAADGIMTEGQGSPPSKENSRVHVKGVCQHVKEVAINSSGAGVVSMTPTGVMRGLCNPVKGPSSRRSGSRPRQSLSASSLGERLVLLNRTREISGQAMIGTGTTSGTATRPGAAVGTTSGTGTRSGTAAGTTSGNGTRSVTAAGTTSGTTTRSGTAAGSTSGTATRSGTGAGTTSGTGTRSGTAAGTGVGTGIATEIVWEVRGVRKNLESCALQQARQSGQVIVAAVEMGGGAGSVTVPESGNGITTSETRGVRRDLESAAAQQTKLPRDGSSVMITASESKNERMGNAIASMGVVLSANDSAVERIVAKPTQQRVLSLQADATVLSRSVDCSAVVRSGDSGECMIAEGVGMEAVCSGVEKLDGEDHLQLPRASVVVRGVGSGGAKVASHLHPFAMGIKLATDKMSGPEVVGLCEHVNDAAMDVMKSLPQFAWMESFGRGVAVAQQGTEEGGGFRGMVVGGSPRPVDGAQGKVPPVVACAVKGRVELSWRDSPCLMGGGQVGGGKGGKGGGSAFVDIASRRCTVGGESRSSSDGASERPSCGLGSWGKWRATDAEVEACAGRVVTGAECEMREQDLEPRRMSNGNQSGSSNESVVGESEESKLGTACRACVGCGTMKTPLWRSGPSGPKSLCNACGIRHKKASKLRASMSGEDNTEPMIRITLATKSIKSGSRKRKATAREVSGNTDELPVEQHVSQSVEVRASLAIDNAAHVEGRRPSSSPRSPQDKFPLKKNMFVAMSTKVTKKGRMVVDLQGDVRRAMAEDEKCRSSSCSEAGEGDHTRSSADSCVTLQASPPSMVSRLMKGDVGSNKAAQAACMRNNPSSIAATGLFPRVSSGHIRSDSQCMEPPIGWGGRRARAGERMSHRDWVRKRRSGLDGPDHPEDSGMHTKLGGRGPSDEVEGAMLLMTLFKGCPVR